MAGSPSHPAVAALGPEGALLSGKTVILTGAAGGIGRHISAALGAAGARVGLTDLSAPGLEPVALDLAGRGVEVAVEAFDGADPDAFAAFHRRVTTELGDVDGLINCAGLWQPKRFQDISPADLTAMLTANVTTAFVACRAALPAMIARSAGSVVNFASTAGEYGSISPAAHYAAAKGAIIGMTKSLAREAGPHNVRVNAVSPGPTDTVALGAATPEQKADVGARTLFNRLGAPEEIAAACIFLVSDMSSFVTGHVLRANGGSLL